MSLEGSMSGSETLHGAIFEFSGRGTQSEFYFIQIAESSSDSPQELLYQLEDAVSHCPFLLIKAVIIYHVQSGSMRTMVWLQLRL